MPGAEAARKRLEIERSIKAERAGWARIPVEIAFDPDQVGVDPVAQDAWAFEHLLDRGREYPEYIAKAEEKGSGRVDWDGRVKETT